MKFSKLMPTLLVFLITVFSSVAVRVAEPSIIPRPSQLAVEEGAFTINSSTGIYLSSKNPELKAAAEYFSKLVKQSSEIALPIEEQSSRKAPPSAIFLVLADQDLGNEGYELRVRENGIHITAQTAQGIFYGLQTVRQLLPPQIESSEQIQGLELLVPFVEIKDRPRYAWRGLMLDESRHFFGKAYVMKLLDQMALLKMNVFHWHLTDTPGWRMEVKKYPRLTTVGGIGDHSNPNGPCTFYTQDDIREIIAYAADRYIQVMPEIDMPGHAAAACRAYPEHSGGGSKKHPDFTFNPGRQKTYEFLGDILKETADLFPAPWIHYGGDEVHFANKQWAVIPEVQALMAEHGLKSLKEVEHYFNRRMADEISRLGKKTVAWDEVVDAGTDPDETIIIWWRHNKPNQLSKALENGYDVVLSPRRPCYFDFVQLDAHRKGRRWDGFNDLKQVYTYPSFPVEISDKQHKQILGMQASMWTETVQTHGRCDFMIFPRLSALAEAAWTNADRKDYEHYNQRLRRLLKRYDVLEVDYFNPFAPDKTPELLK